MAEIDRAIRHIRPKLRYIAPDTFWVSVIFGIFNIIVGFSLFNATILFTLKLLGIIPIKMWGVIFFLQGVIMLIALAVNNWKLIRGLHFFGIAIKTAWLLELFAVILTGRSPFILYVWSLILALQFVTWIYFTPRVERDK